MRRRIERWATVTAFLVMLAATAALYAQSNQRHEQGCERARAFHEFIVTDTQLATARQTAEPASERRLDRQAAAAWAKLARHVLAGC